AAAENAGRESSALGFAPDRSASGMPDPGSSGPTDTLPLGATEQETIPIPDGPREPVPPSPPALSVPQPEEVFVRPRWWQRPAAGWAAAAACVLVGVGIIGSALIDNRRLQEELAEARQRFEQVLSPEEVARRLGDLRRDHEAELARTQTETDQAK